MKTSLNDSLQDFLGVEHIVPAGRGSLGIYAALRVWGDTGIVAVPSAVCQDVIAAILMANWMPFFCDIDPLTGLTKSTEWARARQGGAKAAIVVHLYGNAANTIDARVAFPEGLVIDDAAQALGARFLPTSRLAGTEGNIGVFSFGKSKQIEVGGAILACGDLNFAKACASELAAVLPAASHERLFAESTFRNGLKMARQRLVKYGEVQGFANLLNGYFPALRVGWQPEWSDLILSALAIYPEALSIRREKTNIWHQLIAETDLKPVGMGADAAPWRFVCRLPGCDWQQQQELADALRNQGLDVSNWYLPSHWLMRGSIEKLSGTEQLAQEVFQFWIDPSIDTESILQSGKILKKYSCKYASK